MSNQKEYLVSFTSAGSTYSSTTPVTGKARAMAEAERLAGAGAEFGKKGEGPMYYSGAAGVAYVTE
jgi:hypothetical protein